MLEPNEPTQENKEVEAQPSEVCRCGRELERNHCPMCGSASVYAKSSLSFKIKTPDGERKVMAYHCRGCGEDYNDLARFDCKAPVKAKRLTEIVIPNPLEGLNSEDRMKKLNEMLMKAGLDKRNKE